MQHLHHAGRSREEQALTGLQLDIRSSSQCVEKITELNIEFPNVRHRLFPECFMAGGQYPAYVCHRLDQSLVWLRMREITTIYGLEVQVEVVDLETHAMKQ